MTIERTYKSCWGLEYLFIFILMLLFPAKLQSPCWGVVLAMLGANENCEPMALN